MFTKFVVIVRFNKTIHLIAENSILTKVKSWFSKNNWEPQPFQIETWAAYLEGKSGIVNAPTGSGKTYSIFLATLAETQNYPNEKSGLKLIWITPIRSLAKEIHISCERALKELDMSWTVEVRTGDSSSKTKLAQYKNPPQVLITTPESLHVLFSTKGYANFFNQIRTVVVDEWHELLGSKRGVQTQLALSKFLSLNPNLKIWGISATIGNMDDAQDVLLYGIKKENQVLIKSKIKKEINVTSIMPDEIERFPWAGHLGLKLADQILPIIDRHQSCLIFTNTRAQCEIWYQYLLNLEPDLAGTIAMHHGSIGKEIRDWVEEALYEGKLKAVICTSSLDLGVDFRPVDAIVQIGSPKGVSRFVQRAGRSGHRPGEVSKIYFLPTNALELIEISGLRDAIENENLEERIPYIRSFDVLIQYLMTLAVSDGFRGEELYQEIIKTYAFQSVSKEEWQYLLNIIVNGCDTLQAYDEYQKVIHEDGFYYVNDKKVILKHKLSIGTIVSEGMMQIKLVKGTYLGTVEEWFVTQLNVGDHFWFAGRSLELVRIKDMTAQVKVSNNNKGKIPSYMGGRMPLSSQMAEVLREKIYQSQKTTLHQDIEIAKIIPLLDMQKKISKIPKEDEFLVEYFETKDGFHLLMYPFEGRNVHEGMASLIAKRISMVSPISFTMSMNDYGFELLSDIPIDIDSLITKKLFDSEHLVSDIYSSLNSVELAKRRFRDIARISGLIFQGFPGKQKKDRHLQASTQLIFEVFKDYEPENLLFKQAFEEVLTFQLEESRMRDALARIRNQTFLLMRPKKPTPFSFPLIVDRLREKLSSEKLEDRIKKMTVEYSK